MHQIGLIRTLRAMVILGAALIVAAQLFAVVTASNAQSAEKAVPAMPTADASRLGAVGFDGAAPREPVDDRRASLLR